MTLVTSARASDASDGASNNDGSPYLCFKSQNPHPLLLNWTLSTFVQIEGIFAGVPCRRWLAVEATPPAQTLDPNPSDLTDTFLLASMMVLRRVARGSPEPLEGTMAGAALGFQEALTYLVVPLAELCHCQGPNQATAIALLLQTSHRSLLPSSTWLHCVDRVRPRGPYKRQNAPFLNHGVRDIALLDVHSAELRIWSSCA